MVLSLGITASASTFTTQDALTILRAAAGLIELTAEQRELYDLNNDGKVDSADAIAVLRIAAGLPAFPPPPMGNTSGNLANGGVIAFDSTHVFFTGHGRPITRVAANNSGRIELGDNNFAGNGRLNIVGNHLYYSGVNGNNSHIYRVNKDGSSRTTLVTIDGYNAPYFNVVGEHIYYLDAGILYRVNLDGTSRQKLADTTADVRHFTVYGDYVYYFTVLNKFHEGVFSEISRVKTDGSGGYENIVMYQSPSETFSIIYQMMIDGDKIYYSTNSPIVTDGRTRQTQTLRRANLDGSGQEIVLDSVLEGSFNVTGGWIYYFESTGDMNMWSQYSIFKARADGTGKVELISGVGMVEFAGLHVHGNWIYLFESRGMGEYYMTRISVNGGARETFG
jgi:hypothetical protein